MAAAVYGSELGSMTLATNGKAQFKTSRAAAARLELESAETGDFCTYGLTKLGGAARYGAGYIVDVSFTKQTLKLVEDNIATCPKKVAISVALALKTAAPGSSEEKDLAAYNPAEGIVS